jgi:hypothetical protein
MRMATASPPLHVGLAHCQILLCLCRGDKDQAVSQSDWSATCDWQKWKLVIARFG